MLRRLLPLILALAVAGVAVFPLAAQSKKSRSRSSSSRQAAKQRQPDAARVSEIQQALIETGHLKGEPSSKWDAATEMAMKEFQQVQGYPATGKPDALSLIRLGLGPKTAGQGAPVPPANGSAPVSVAATNSGPKP